MWRLNLKEKNKMGQKAHPTGFRLGISKDWKSKWYAEGKYKTHAFEDLQIRRLIKEKAEAAGIERIGIARALTELTITLSVAKPGIAIGRGGQGVEGLKKALIKLTGLKIKLDIEEVKRPQLSAPLVAQGIASQIERRFRGRRVITQTADRVMEAGALGVKIEIAGLIGGSKYSRVDKVSLGSVPLQTLRADIDYASETAHAGPKGATGVKVWIYKGEKEI